MGGFSSVTSDETIVFADNVSFDGTQRGGKVTTDAQLLIGSTASPHIRKGTLTSTGATVQVTYASPNINLEAGTTKTTKFTDNGTWIKHPRTQFVTIYAWGGGGGGGGGSTGLIINAVPGGWSGCAGNFVNISLEGSAFNAATAITVGTGGAGGAGAVIGGGSGAEGTNGGNTTIALASGSSIVALGGPRGDDGGGGVISISCVNTSFINTDGFYIGTNYNNQSTSPANFQINNIFGVGPAGAGGGGGLADTGVALDGSNASSIYFGTPDVGATYFTQKSLILAGGLGGVGDGVAGAAGNTNTTGLIMGATGGGGGASSILTAGGAGGNGAIPSAGGGGGGASIIGAGAGGAGGAGARGEVWIIEYIG